jgi:hypothetical protein
MATTQLQDLITLALQRSNQESSGIFGPSELTTYINNSLAELYDILTTTYEDYDSHIYLSTLTGASNVIPLFSAVNKVRLVEFQYMSGNIGGASSATSDNYYPIQMFMMPQRNQYGNTPINIFLPYALARITYRVMGQEIIIEPVASCAGNYRIWYTQKWQNLINLTDYLPENIDTQAWSEYAIVDCCIKMFDKMNVENTGFRQEKAELKDRIVSAAKNRMTGGPKRMFNARRRNRGGGGGFSSGGLW